MKKELSNKGFSLVELIIVIAIMAVLVGLLAPQYFKYVDNSRVATDISNSEELATVFGVAFANGQITPGTYTGTENAAMGPTVDIANWPELKYSQGTSWQVTLSGDGVTSVYIGCGGTYYEGFPNPQSANGYYTAFHR